MSKYFCSSGVDVASWRDGRLHLRLHSRWTTRGQTGRGTADVRREKFAPFSGRLHSGDFGVLTHPPVIMDLTRGVWGAMG